MNVSSGEAPSQEEIEREMASAMADDVTTKINLTDSTFEQGDLGQVTSKLITSESDDSFVTITAKEETKGQGSVALSFDGPVIKDDSSEVSTQGVWSWISSAVGNDFVETTQRIGRNLVQKTKDSMDSVITTLDPGMENYLSKTSSETVSVVVTTADEAIVEGIKDGFKQVFSHVHLQNYQSHSSLAPLPSSFSSALKSAKQKILNLRHSHTPEPDVVVVAIEEFIAEVMSGKWFGMFALCLEDSMHTVETETFSQAIALSSDLVKKLEELSPSSYSLRWSGYSVTLSEVLQNDWTNFTAGVSKRQVITLAARILAGQYKEKRQTKGSLLEKSISV